MKSLLESAEEKFQTLENRVKEREYNLLAEIENVCISELLKLQSFDFEFNFF